jgi:hypothetical protein
VEVFLPKLPAKPRNIGEVRVEDQQVVVVGIVVEKRELELVIDDGTGQATVTFDSPALAESVETGSAVKVFGTPMEAEGGIEIRAEILQPAPGLDFKLYQEAREELKKLERKIVGG